jgi:hypothetical protein
MKRANLAAIVISNRGFRRWLWPFLKPLEKLKSLTWRENYPTKMRENSHI